MTESNAARIADEYIKLILQNQQSLLGSAPLQNDETALYAAQGIAAFRKELIRLLVEQPTY
ncbi:MAG: hypothetical protein M0Q87_06235 [Ottowia sp.]|nr:hypothetical protein [Ottowia sp.]